LRDYRYDHVHLRSPDPDATARFFETMFGAEVKRSVYPPGTLYPGQQRITMRLGGQTVLIAPPHPHEPNATAPSFPHYGLEHIGLTVDDVDVAVEELRAKGAEIRQYCRAWFERRHFRCRRTAVAPARHSLAHCR
jgi:catechol 2,3-dioxygenase-like lactoylglutathione lyase family enzyme